MKLSSPRAFWPVVMAAVTVIITLFFATIIVTRQAIGMSIPVSSLSGSLDSSDGSFDSSDRYAES